MRASWTIYIRSFLQTDKNNALVNEVTSRVFRFHNSILGRWLTNLTRTPIYMHYRLSGKGCHNCDHCYKNFCRPRSPEECCWQCPCQICRLAIAQVVNNVSGPLSIKPMWFWTTQVKSVTLASLTSVPLPSAHAAVN
jgi:hypothetical protein